MKRFILLSLLLTGFISSFAQHQNVLISTSNNPEEPSIIINPKNTNQLYGGANISSYYYSSDAGFTWNEGTITSPEYGVWGDPVMLCDTAGAFYFFHLSNPPMGGSWIDRIVCQKTETLGGPWNDGSYMGLNGTKAQDKHWAAVDWKNNHIYVTWTQFDAYGTPDPYYFSNIMFSRSYDGGMSWSEALQINKMPGNCTDSDTTTEGAVPCVGPEGQIYVSWADSSGLIFDRSLDQGDTWLENDIFVSDIGGGWDYAIPGIYRANGLPVTTCDTSNGPYRGTIYINWTDQRNGAFDTDVWLVKSTDGGNTWSSPKRVNDDPPGKQQFFTWMCIDQTNGYLYFVFYDRRNYEDNNTDVYMARSTDGGETFLNFQISEEPFVPYSTTFFGDYTNITAHNNVIRPIWTRLQNGELSIWTAIIDTASVGISEEAINATPVSLGQSYPNPFIESTWISFKLHEAAPVYLGVYDNLGRIISVLVDNAMLQPGKYSYQFKSSDFHLAPGVYHFRLVSNDIILQQKIILAR